MIISVPINHTVVGTLKGKRTETSQSHTNFIDLPIRSVRGEDAPIVMTWDDTPPDDISLYEKDQWWSKQKAPASGLQTLRTIDNQFCIRHHSDINTENISDPSTQEYINKLLDLSEWGSHKPPFDKAGYRTELPIASDFDEITSKALHLSQFLIFIDGDLYVQADEPVLTYECLNIGGHMSAAMRITSKNNVNEKELWRSVLDYDHFVDRLNVESISRFNKTGWQIARDKAPTIYKPDLLSLNFAEANLLRACEIVFNKKEPFSTASIPLARTEPELGIAYLQTKSAYLEWKETGTPDKLIERCLDTNSRFPEMFGSASFFSVACHHYEQEQIVSMDNRIRGPRP
jgi:hypothetical protein